MKKIINAVDQVENQMIDGLCKAYPQYIKKHTEGNVVLRAKKADKVALVSGGGSGHEPAHGGFVGKGMLDAACPGAVFAAPPMNFVYECTKKIATDAGVLHIVNNYQGDKMAWDMGREMAEAEGIKIGTVIVNDDVSVEDSLYTVGRRGVAGNFFVIKACGAAAEKGAGGPDS